FSESLFLSSSSYGIFHGSRDRKDAEEEIAGLRAEIERLKVPGRFSPSVLLYWMSGGRRPGDPGPSLPPRS
ncbi:MAG TPA: hypothetical protein VIJ26_06810, partial [Thermoanaerobaculia bacterium]